MKLEELPTEINQKGLEKLGAEKIKGFEYFRLRVDGWEAFYEPMGKNSENYVLRNARPIRDENQS